MQSDNAIAEWSQIDLAGIHVDLPDINLPDIDLLGIRDFDFEPNFSPGSEDEQGQLDERKPVDCPHCGKSFVPN